MPGAIWTAVALATDDLTGQVADITIVGELCGLAAGGQIIVT